MFLIGAWVSFDHLEESLTLEELMEAYGAIRDREEGQFRRDAALQGVRIPTKEEEEAKKALERINQRARAGKSDKGFGSFGLGYKEA